uniref:Succinate--CoA ligase [GDP-forming] subunit beta, mitochondrial n=1 Tax=Haemonchus contortus TaxID=6289 RepID=A0A7I4YJJ0_HAECO
MLRCASKLLGRTSFGKASQQRFLNLQEHHSKELLDKHGCRVQNFIVATSQHEADQKSKARGIQGPIEYVVKSQILAGGRGKGRFINGKEGLGGVFVTRDRKQALDAVAEMVGKHLVTKQTPKEGVLVKKVMVAKGVSIKRETYLAVLMDRASNGPVIVASPAGGMDIEEVAEKTPHLIFKEPVNIATGITDEQATRIAKSLEFKGELVKDAAHQIKCLYELFLAVDATQVEINPFAETDDGLVYCVDAKINFDDSAAFRQQEIFALGEKSEQDPREVEADKYHLNYIAMDGNIACLVNGAGLAMATMDIIKLKGGDPANFLDVGGTVTEEQVSHAFRIITSDPRVKCILVNIFGGIVNCGTIANGLVAACRKMKLRVPLVVRLEGTNVDEARNTLEKSGLPIITAGDLSDAAEKAVEALH